MFGNGKEPLWSQALSRACACQGLVWIFVIVQVILWISHGCEGP